MEIENVSDTSLWVATYRAQETERPDALFRDPLASVLIGERGRAIEQRMRGVGAYVEWSVILRTVIIDDFIEKLVREGVDTVVNLGAGLDTRPYRMDLPTSLRWIEVDYPNIIDLKNTRLADQKPRCSLERIALDLADDNKRLQFLKSVPGQKVLVITEGVILYLTQPQVARLAQDLRSCANVNYWIAEYFHPAIYKHLRATAKRGMQRAPLTFYPEDWFKFFANVGWRPRETKYVGEESIVRGRSAPLPWWARLLKPFVPKAAWEAANRHSGYTIFEKL